MYLGRGNRELGWWSPVERGIFPLDGLRVTRSMRQSSRRLECTVNMAFRSVMEACATVRTDANWITSDFIEAYCELHDLGWAHSVEVWSDDRLVGGLYGVRINGFFAGESMFHFERDASKVALMHLVDLMRLDNMALLDAQVCTEHLATLGCIQVPRWDYLRLLETATGIAILGE